MNTLLHLYHIKQQYDHGTQTGLAGIFGIVLAIAAVYFWEYIYPVLSFLGIVSLVDRLGLIYEGSPEMTFFAILSVYCVLTLFFALVALCLLYTVMILVRFNFSFSTFFSILLLPFVMILCLPALIPTLIYAIIELFKDGVLFIKDRQAYKEQKRLRKNVRTTYYIKNKGKEIPFNDARDMLHRLPTYHDAAFLVGIDYDRNAYILLPSYKQAISGFKGIPVKIAFGPVSETDKRTKARLQVDIDNGVKNLFELNVEEVYDCSASEEMQQLFKEVTHKIKYRTYVDKVIQEYRYIKGLMLRRISEAENNDERANHKRTLEDVIVGNEEIIELMSNS